MTAPASSSTETTPTPNAPAPYAKRRWLGRAGALVLLPLVAATGALWVWSGTDHSLQDTVQLVQKVLPEHMQLQAVGVQGSVRHGGRFEHLTWTQAGTEAAGFSGGQLEVKVAQGQWQWSLPQLLRFHLHIEELQARSVTLQDTRTRHTPAPKSEPLQSLTLPLGIQTPFHIQEIRVLGAQPEQDTVLQNLAGSYRYDRSSTQHSLQLDSLQVAQGFYSGSAWVTGQAPMETAIGLAAIVNTPAQGQQPSQRLLATATASGTLSGLDGLLQVTSHVRPASGVTEGAPRLDLDASVFPWRGQPLQRALASWQHLDLQAFVPNAPRTVLQGELRVEPQSANDTPTTAPAVAGMLDALGPHSWQATMQMRNTAAGPYDQGQLPLSEFNTNARFAQGALSVDQLQLVQGTKGGQLLGNLQYQPAKGWTGTIDVQKLNLGLLDSRFAATPISGKIEAHTPLNNSADAAQTPVDFSAKLRSEGGQRSVGLALDVVDITGQWQNHTVTLPNVLVRARDAVLQGSASYATRSQAATADLGLTLPGGNAKLQGHISETDGQGQLQVNASNLAHTMQWLQQWPGLRDVNRSQFSGNGHLQAQWRGGWQQQGQKLTLNASLNAPQLGMQQGKSTTVLRNTQFSVNGTLAQAQVQAQTALQQDQRHLELALNGNAGMRSQNNVTSWFAKLQATQLQAREQLKGQSWQAKLAQAVPIDIAHDAQGLQLQTGAIHIQLTGNQVPGTAALVADPIRFIQTDKSYTLTTKGRIDAIPLAWVDALVSNGEKHGLAGDLLLRGQWDVELGSTMRVHALVERSRGDLTIMASDLGGYGQVQAGLRAARLELNGSAGNLQTTVLWDSSNAGRANALVSTRLSRANDGGWTLAETAPLSGNLQANLPRVGIWSIFAPPGWRLRGTLNANAQLGGTLQSPQVNGTLNADNLGVRSVVDGIEFSQGTLRTRFQGQRLDIDKFELLGPQVNRRDGGSIQMSGYMTWGGGSNLLQSLQANLTTELRQLQIFTMPERQITLSGKISTVLANLRLQMRGGIRADQGLIDLGGHTGSSVALLDSDVVILPSKKHPRAVLAQPNQALTAEAHKVANSRDVKTGTARTNATITPDIEISLDMGDNFRVRGKGLDTYLRGTPVLRSGSDLAAMPTLNGNIYTERGTFRAYGQDLQVQQGEIVFRNTLSNPDLNIRAIRPHLDNDMVVGVQIRGTAQKPVVRLFSTPDMPDSEKLSWLILGRSSTSAADTALLQQAAFALLAGDGRGITGSLADAVGLDEITFSGGDGGLAGGSVTLGKRFAHNFYVTYEQGLNAAMGTLYFFYDINRRMKLRAYAGESNTGLDLVYTWTFDHWGRRQQP